MSINGLHINDQIICRLKTEICKLIAAPLLFGNYLSKIAKSLTCMMMPIPYVSIHPSKKERRASRFKIYFNHEALYTGKRIRFGA